jgi:iron complex transport system permease protein
VSTGAAVGAVAVIATGVGSQAPGLLPAAAMAGAVLTIGVVLRIASRLGGALDTRVLLLAGVVVGAFLNAVILLFLTYADLESFRSAIFWMMGSLASARWGPTLVVAAYVVPSSALLISLARPLNLISLGEETAFHLGIRVEPLKRTAYLVASLLVAASVAFCGVIGFVGLIVPHALRMLWGSDHRLLLPGSFLAGGTFLLLADTLARTVAAPAELPVLFRSSPGVMMSVEAPNCVANVRPFELRCIHHSAGAGRKIPISVFPSPSKSNDVRRGAVAAPEAQKPESKLKLPPRLCVPASG